MNARSMISPFFVVAALYDALLGIIFLFLGGRVFLWLEITPPNHFGYVQFPAALLIVFAVMFAAIARDPVGNRNLILFGVLLKVSYCGVVLRYWLTTDLPGVWKLFFLFDLVFLILFVWAWRVLGKDEAGENVAR